MFVSPASHYDIVTRERGRLIALAYRMLGSRGDAEDVVQEALARLPVDNEPAAARGFLTTVVTRLCLDELKSARRRREAYVGPWLPEPFANEPSPEDRESHRSEVSLALLLILEQLTARERVVFVLREMVDSEFSEIAEAVGATESTCRKLLQRARDKVQAAQSSEQRPADPELTMRFLAAAASGDVTQLIAMLAPNATLIMDHGGKAKAARNVMHGALDVAKLMAGTRKWSATEGIQLELHRANGGPLVLGVDTHGVCVLAAQLELSGAHVSRVLVYRNPDKLQRLAALRTR